MIELVRDIDFLLDLNTEHASIIICYIWLLQYVNKREKKTKPSNRYGFANEGPTQIQPMILER
jgi:hypothetical protein